MESLSSAASYAAMQMTVSYEAVASVVGSVSAVKQAIEMQETSSGQILAAMPSLYSASGQMLTPVSSGQQLLASA